MRVLMIGDVVGRLGRRAVRTLLPGLRKEFGLDLVVANGENAAGGFGITPETAQELLNSGVDIITTGNHIWDQMEIVPELERGGRVLRPLNYPPTTPGQGHAIVVGVLVVNLIGRVFVGTWDCPFRAVDGLLRSLPKPPKVVLVDFHAEATSEKVAMGWYLDGRVSAVVGTHTHVPTADARIFPKGTGFVTDLGMVGPMESVIGVEVQDVLTRFLDQTPQRLRVATKGRVCFNSVMFDIDDATGRATAVSRLDRQIT
ncbi:MAG: TIGR00282 family metallophosphoesterase [SAR202 cluster bacterium]|nr:TIGR00282 family metallophosphoesterase [SAR202 cluster bacterium]